MKILTYKTVPPPTFVGTSFLNILFLAISRPKINKNISIYQLWNEINSPKKNYQK